MWSLDDTIAAVSTPMGEGGIGIVRLSGSQARVILRQAFRPAAKAALDPESHRLYYGHLVAPETGETIDEVLAVWMAAPRTYTRQDVVEIHCHGGIVALRRALELLLRSGARLARPGEFTLRAFLNGRIDLAQAEAVLDIVRAKTEVSLGKNDFVGSGEAPFFLRQGKITTLYPVPVLRPDSAIMWDFISTGPVELKDLDQHILWRITFIWNLPFTFRIEHDQDSSGLAQRVADQIKTVAARLGVSDLVGVQSVLVEPVPEQAFLGQWKVDGKGDIQALDVQPGGKCALTWSRDARSKRAGTTVTYPWTITTKEIIIDPSEDSKADWNWYTYRGYVNADAHLALEKGVIFPQGAFYRAGDPTMVFERVK